MKFENNRLLSIGLIIFFIIFILTALAPVISNYEYDSGDLSNMRQAPSKEHRMGTDEIGRDVFTRILYGGRISLLVSLSSMLIQLSIGVVLGTIAGYYGGWIDIIISRFIDIILCFPFFLIAISIVSIVGPSLLNLILIIGLLTWPETARVVRSQVMKEKEKEYVEAAKLIGFNTIEIIIFEILPNICSTILVSSTLAIATGIMLEASLSFLGLGVNPPYPSWGNMLMAAQNMSVIQNEWWLWIFPGGMIVITVLSINLIGEGLKFLLDPELKEKSKGKRQINKVVRSSLAKEQEELLKIDNLSVDFKDEYGTINAVNNISFSLGENEIVVLVGESGSGKSVTADTIMSFIEEQGGSINSGSIYFDNKNLLSLEEKELKKIRGNEIAFISQNSMTSLNPVIRIGKQLNEVLLIHNYKGNKEIKIYETLKQIGFKDPKKILKSYPFQLSGGEKQRIAICMALISDPKIVIADEPTTALDVTTQSEILEIFENIVREGTCSILMITHDLGIVSEIADRVIVMYRGEILEESSVVEFFDNPKHPYSEGLIKSGPIKDNRYFMIDGEIPSPYKKINSCIFYDRCNKKSELCLKKPKDTVIDKRKVKCHIL